MPRALILGACLGALGMGLVQAGAAWAQASISNASSSPDPVNALWSLLGSMPVAGVLYTWLRNERQDRQSEQTERRQTLASKDQLMAKMIELLEADISHKAELRERLKGQDQLLSQMQDSLGRLERQGAARSG